MGAFSPITKGDFYIIADRHDRCPRHHPRKRLRDLMADGEAPLRVNSPWRYQLSELYDEPAVTAAVEKIAAKQHSRIAA